MRLAVFITFSLLLIVQIASAFTVDSVQYKIISLDSLSDEDFALLEEYKDSFMKEVTIIKSALLFKKQKPLDTTVTLMNKLSHVELGLDFASHILSNGRDAGIKGIAFYPGIMYYHKTGLYASLGMGFFTDSAIRQSAKVPLLFISPGFYRTFFKRWTFSIGYSRCFNFYSPDFNRGLLNNSFSLYNAFDFWHYLTVSVAAGISWSSNLTSRKLYQLPARRITYKKLTQNLGEESAANISISLRRDFSFYNTLGAKVFTITPQLSFLFGNDNSQFVIKGIRKPGQFPVTYDKFFGFLNIDPGLGVDWRIRNLEISVAFHCAIPFNEFVENGNVSGRITSPHHYYPYAEAGIKYLFRIKKKK